MKKILSALLIFLLNLNLFSERLGKDPDEYSYTSLGIEIASQNEDLSVGINASLALPGPLYFTFSQAAVGIEQDDADGVSFDQEVRNINIGAHVGIGDLLNSISVGSVSLNLDNFMDVFFELGIKKYVFESEPTLDESFGNIAFGAKFGDANGWEGKFYFDLSKEVDNYSIVATDEGDPTLIVDFSDERDLKFGLDFQFNASKHSSIVLGFKTSEYLETETSISLNLQY